MTRDEYFREFRESFPRTKEEFDHITKDLILYTSEFTTDDNKNEYSVGKVFKTVEDSNIEIGDIIYSKNEKDFLTNLYSCKACKKDQVIKYKISKPKVEQKEKIIPKDSNRYNIKKLKKCMDILYEIYELDPEFTCKNLISIRAQVLLYHKVKEEIKDSKQFKSMWGAICMYKDIQGHPQKRLNACAKKFNVDSEELEKYMKAKGGFKSKAV